MKVASRIATFLSEQRADFRILDLLSVKTTKPMDGAVHWFCARFAMKYAPKAQRI
jgi:hypothetical protein